MKNILEKEQEVFRRLEAQREWSRAVTHNVVGCAMLSLRIRHLLQLYVTASVNEILKDRN